MRTHVLFLLARIAWPLRVNLNWLGDPVHSWRIGEPFFLRRR